MANNLIERLERAKGSDNALDIEAEIALFESDEHWKAIRANSVNTKVIYTDWDGNEVTCLAWDWTLTPENRADCIAALRAKGTD